MRLARDAGQIQELGARSLLHMLGTTHSEQSQLAVPSQREHSVDLSVELTEEEYHQASQALAEFLRFTLQLNLFGIVVLNHKDYFNAFNTQLNTFAHRRETNELLDIETIIIELNQHLINFLSSISLYLTHTQAYIERKHGKNAKNSIEFAQHRSRLYDANFSYRFIYFLRNYAQHAGLPIDSISLDSEVSGNDPRKVLHSMKVAISRDSLLKNYHWKTRADIALQREISQLSETIEINLHLNNMMKMLEEIYSKFVADESYALEGNANYLNILLQRLPSNGGDPQLFEVELDTVSGKEAKIRTMRAAPIPDKLVKAVLAQVRR